MNYNRFSFAKLERISDKINSRAKLDTGTHCNYECSFCYYLDKLDQVTPLETIKKRAKKIRDFGVEEIDLSGGESSIHENWFEILEYCRELGFCSISCLSNGSRFSNMSFLKRSQEAGLSEILFSLHGWNAEGHDAIVGRKGAFKRMLKAIENAKELGLKARINCTVTSYNAPRLKKYVELVNNIFPAQMNFLPLNYWEDASKVKSENYELLAEPIKEAIDALNPDIEINVRYIPYCFMRGYEKYVVGVYQHIYDAGDWNIITYDVDRFEMKEADVEDYFNCANEKRMHSYAKNKECFDCKHFFICDGIEHKVVNEQKVYPDPGEKITDVMHYRRKGKGL